ncbi:carboxypeptidase-like regulatory domain-containing protein [Hymenobacter sp. RP-2-7]|uniref:Carboxypeptidase-like regulatory domain-containing protein n=1 Tax=Hymenobacter polaris TaxID=2682546 RepID=A0A7Y0FPL6_9BACT|nr:carboxypeptidase-like regulatory domain-containing protein [Hymenobacter polaris]NML67771.1 carboxypeptidase-like regulatory domain-containing protein [Hymenobacter polaris]
MRCALLALLLLLPGWALAQAALSSTLSGTVRDSLTQKPLPFASVFLANTTLGATTNEQGEFTLARVPAGSYDLVASFVGYRLAKVAVTVGGPAPQQVALPLAPESSQLGEVVVRARRHANRPEDYQRFIELFLGRTSFSRQCRIRNPRAVIVDYDAKANELTASATDYVEVENQALGYRLKYYGMHFSANFGQQLVTFYGQPVFEELVPRSAGQRQRWANNRATAYRGSLTHFLCSVYLDKVAAQGFLAQKLRVIPNPPFARADSLRRQLLRQHQHTALSSAEMDSVARWARVYPSLQLLYTAPRPLDSLRRVAPDGRVYLRFTDYLRVTYSREPPDPLYPGPPRLPGGPPDPPPRQQVSRLQLLAHEAELQPNGQLLNPLAVLVQDYWGFEKMGEFLPLNYAPLSPIP